MSGATGERARLFVALELPASARDILARWRGATLRDFPSLRPVPVEYLHATLCFVGSRPASQIDEIAAACGVVAGEPVVEARLGEPVWLPTRRPRVLAVRLSDASGGLARVQAALSSALVAGGWYAPESRPFLAHVTVARVAKDAQIRPPQLEPPPGADVRCSRVTLYRSRLGSSGARYEPLNGVELGSEPLNGVELGSEPLNGVELGSEPLNGVELGSAAGAADPLSVVQRFYGEQARLYADGEPDGVRGLLADDVVWHVPGASAIAGEHRGVDAVLAYMDERRRIMDGTFRVTVHGAALIAGRVVQLAGGHAMRAGREVAWETVGVFRVSGGRIVECWLIPFDQAAFDAVWS